ncbi:hypothetical protein lerEdw1_016976 [Lerista edwardsae]|nr:hypothetical protein lerEdw1_016976 [Lerista edwardsae]
MNINDFVILPGSKTGLSVKLKAKSVRELQLEKVQLELENKEMEKKLQQLQSNMSREKQERERANGYHWKTGQSGFSTQPQLLSQNKENVGKVSSGKVKLRVLKEQVQAPEPAKRSHAHAHKVATHAAPVEKPRLKGKACGQCDMKMALLVCLECAEDYCPGCFARVHQKGALKLHRTTSLQAKVRVPIGKLEAAQQFLKKINLDESNGQINNEQTKEVNNALEGSLDMLSILPKPTMYSIEEATVPTEARPENQNGRSLLQGTFDEGESAKSFQEALNQWRAGSSSQKYKEEETGQLGSENPDTCEVQTSPPINKKPIDFEFKEDSLKYMERLLLKKHRRTPVDKLPDAVIEGELSLEKPFISEDYDTWDSEEEEDDDIAAARAAAEEMKMCWADCVQPKDPEIVLANSEPSLKIKILEEACKEELEESANFVVIEAGSDDFSWAVSETEKTELGVYLPQAGGNTIRPFLSWAVDRENDLTFMHNKHGETPRASSPSAQPSKSDATCDCSSAKVILPSSLHEKAIMKEKCTKRKSNGSRTSSEQTPSPELPPTEPFPAMELLKGGKVSPELNEISPGIAKSSLLLQEVALREKRIRTPYQGLEGFFTMHTGSQQWTRGFSFSECADESVVQDVLKRELGRPSTLQLGAKSSASRHLTPAASEISEIEGIDVSERDDPFLECHTDQQALSDLASELQSHADILTFSVLLPLTEKTTNTYEISDPLEKLSGLTSGDLSAFSRHLETTSQNHTVFNNNYQVNDYCRGDSIRVFDETHTDDEEDLLRDKQEVIELC